MAAPSKLVSLIWVTHSLSLTAASENAPHTTMEPFYGLTSRPEQQEPEAAPFQASVWEGHRATFTSRQTYCKDELLTWGGNSQGPCTEYKKPRKWGHVVGGTNSPINDGMSQKLFLC